MALHVLAREQIVPRPRAEVFAFFSDADNLAKLTPPAFGFEMVGTPPRPLRAGAILEHRIRIFRVPMLWRSRIEIFEPNERFVDVQLRGPYRTWRHTHSFEDAVGGTIVRDQVEYEMPFGPAGEVVRLLLVQRQLADLFEY